MGLQDQYMNLATSWGSGVKQVDFEADAHLRKSLPSPSYTSSTTSSDVSVMGLLSPPMQMHLSLSKTNAAIAPGGSAKPCHSTPGKASMPSIASGASGNRIHFLPGMLMKKWLHRRFNEIEHFYHCRYTPIAPSF